MAAVAGGDSPAARLLAVEQGDRLPVYTEPGQVPRDLRTEPELRAGGFVLLGEPVAWLRHLQPQSVAPEGPAAVALYSTSEARKLRGDDWARLPRRSTPAAVPVEERRGRTSLRSSPDEKPKGRAFGVVVRPATARRTTLLDAPRRWLIELFREGFVVVDTETTGLGAHDEVVEVAAVASDGTLLMETLVRPRRAVMHPAASRVNRLSAADLRDAPRWPEVSARLHECIDGRRVLAWNAAFDERLVLQSSRAWGAPHDLPPFECAMHAYAHCRGVGRGAVGLQRAAVIEGVARAARAHRGAEDARLVIAVLEHLRDVSAGRA